MRILTWNHSRCLSHDRCRLSPRRHLKSSGSGSATIERPMVNWDVVTVDWQDLKARVNAGWRKLQSIG